MKLPLSLLFLAHTAHTAQSSSNFYDPVIKPIEAEVGVGVGIVVWESEEIFLKGAGARSGDKVGIWTRMPVEGLELTNVKSIGFKITGGYGDGSDHTIPFRWTYMNTIGTVPEDVLTGETVLQADGTVELADFPLSVGTSFFSIFGFKIELWPEFSSSDPSRQRWDPTGLVATIKADNIEVVPKPTGGVFGDPHFKLLSGKPFDYHGECDLVFAHAPNFGGDPSLGLDIHIRTTRRYDYSYVEAAAVRLGDDILEVGSWGSYALNGVESAELLDMAGAFPVYHTEVNTKKHIFDIVIDENFNVTMTTWKDLVAVATKGDSDSFSHGDFFQGSLGLLGSRNGTLFARDGTTVLDVSEKGDNSILGNEWQVRGSLDPQLFRTLRAPQHPAECKLPSEGASTQRRLREKGISQNEAEKACAHVTNERSHKFCVQDVLEVGDAELAQSGIY